MATDRATRPEAAAATVRRAELFTEERSAEIVAASFDGTQDPRLRKVLTSLVRHLHDFVKDVELTPNEWAEAIGFLTETGRQCTDTRQEFIMLSDVLGVSMLVESIDNRGTVGITEATVEGPFHMVESPRRSLGDEICRDPGEVLVVTGQVTSADGSPVPGAAVDVWHANAEGMYDVQQTVPEAIGNMRGLFTADRDGRFWFRTIVPAHYPIPDDGPVGKLLDSTGRHPYRPAHIHFEVSAPGLRTVTTHLFVADTPYIDSDTVFGVRESLVREFPLVDDQASAAVFGVANPYRTVDFPVVLLTQDGA